MEEITRNEKMTVGVSSIRLSEKFPTRKIILIRNTSSGLQRITVVQGSKPAVDQEGIVLNPGESVIDANSADYTCWRGAILAISDIAAGQVSIYER